MSANEPLLSFVVLSYNYEQYIGTALQSILAQTVQNFEVIVVDDASADRSREVVLGFSDPRIRLLVNARNLGGAASYNRAVLAARGQWLVNLDADDWIAPQKCDRQLAFAEADPSLAIVGTWVKGIGADGQPSAAGKEAEEIINRRHALNRVETWVGSNPLCRSSTMVRRQAHLELGLDDPDMVRAPDYELWTRALAFGLKFGLVQERLTYLRRHSGGVTHGNTLQTLVEMGFAASRSLAPLARARALYYVVENLISWIKSVPDLINLSPREAHRLIGSILIPPDVGNFADFARFLATNREERPLQEPLGQVIRSINLGSYTSEYVAKLTSDYQATCEARDFWRAQAEAYLEARDYFQQVARDWENRAKLETQIASEERQAGSISPAEMASRESAWRPRSMLSKAFSRFTRSSS